jgi:hypothetical protein
MNASPARGTAAAAADQQSATQEAAWMVPAQVQLLKSLDARKTQTGGQFEAVLNGTVYLRGGTALPHGTVLIGTVVADQMQAKGTASLALRFTEAKLKDGKEIPIRAMIAGISGPNPGYGYAAQSFGPPTWDPKTLQVDEVGVLPHVDLHSRVEGPDSGVLVSSHRDDVKLDAGSEMTLAIAARNPGNGQMGGGA